MEKIYGYKREEVINLCEMIKSNPNYSPSKIFTEYSIISGKSKGTIRNMYYALAKLSNNDVEFCNTFLDGKPLEIGKIEGFSSGEDIGLVKKIVELKHKGFSVRKAVLRLADGNDKLALRYMNKYRSTIKAKPQIIDQVVNELGLKDESSKPSTSPMQNIISEVQFKRLKNEINNLVNKISDKVRKENEYLKQRVCVLELQNLKLNNMVYGDKSNSALKFFTRKGDSTEFIN